MTEPTKKNFWEERAAKLAAEKLLKKPAATPSETHREPKRPAADPNVKARE